MLVVLWRITSSLCMVSDNFCVCIKMVCRYTNIVELLVTTREGNQELISSILELSRQVNDNSKMLEALDSTILDSQLSWSTIISSLVIMGELYASFSPVDLAENGYYVSMFSETRASEFLTQWMLDNGGLVSKSVELTHGNIMI